MRKKIFAALLAAPVLVVGIAFTIPNSTPEKPVQAEEYVCPVTGEVLPCPRCCPYAETK